MIFYLWAFNELIKVMCVDCSVNLFFLCGNWGEIKCTLKIDEDIPLLQPVFYLWKLTFEVEMDVSGGKDSECI